MKEWFSKQTARLRSSAWVRVVMASAIVLAAVVVGLSIHRAAGAKPMPFTELSRLADTGEIESVGVDGERFVVKRVDGSSAVAIVGDSETRHDLVTKLATANVPVVFESRDEGAVSKALTVAIPVLVFVVLGGFVVRMQQRKGRHFTKFCSSERSREGFGDVAGMYEAKEALAETVEFLKNPGRFGRLGGRPPRGVLLTGEPGTGKTLLARAVAAEASVPFLSTSGSAFQEMFVGVGAQRIRALFSEARRVAPCIIFIDEVDAVGRARARSTDSASADHDQTLNQLLVEMDGFDHETNIVVIASTNRADVLDPALRRPGRFDRHVSVPLPSLRGREEILAVHARPIPLGDSVDLAHVARGTPGFSGADLANLLNEAAILAAREDAFEVGLSHVERARDLVMMGAERRDLAMDEADLRATAVHEAGHVAVGVSAPNADPVHKVSILPRSRTLGVTHSLPERDRHMYRREYLEDQLCLMMGGRAAEMMILGTQTAGAADDIQRATALARRMVAEFGMSDLGPISLADSSIPHSPALLDRVEEAARKIVASELARACQIVLTRRAQIDELVRRLLDEETLDAQAIKECFAQSA